MPRIYVNTGLRYLQLVRLYGNREMDLLLCIYLCSVVLYLHRSQGNNDFDKEQLLVHVNPIINVHALRAVRSSHSHGRGC